MKKVECSVAEYEEVFTCGYRPSVETYVNDLFLDEDKIVHCKDNDQNYTKQDAQELVAYIESRIIE